MGDMRTSLAMRSGDEFFRVLANQKNCRTLDRHDFENHFEHARLKLLCFANAADGRADFQQCRQITREATAWRE